MMNSSFPEFSRWVGVWGGWWLCAGVLHEYSRASDVKSFCILFLASGKFSLMWSPAWHGTYVVSNLVFNVFFQCDRPCQLPLARLSWIPNALDSACLVVPPSFIPHHSPRSSIVDEFNKILCYIYIVRPTLWQQGRNNANNNLQTSLEL